jgi:ABC-type oligopeptide transport system ATPase subunit
MTPSSPLQASPDASASSVKGVGQPPILEVENLKKFYEIKTGFFEKKILKALNGISFSVAPKTTLGIVGETGCGKSTLAKTIMQIVEPTEGDIRIHGESYKKHSKTQVPKKNPNDFSGSLSLIKPSKESD